MIFLTEGKNSGLMVILDAHSDQLDAFSVGSDYEGFTALIGQQEEFPLVSMRGFNVRPGLILTFYLNDYKKPSRRHVLFAKAFTIINVFFLCYYNGSRINPHRNNSKCPCK